MRLIFNTSLKNSGGGIEHGFQYTNPWKGGTRFSVHKSHRAKKICWGNRTRFSVHKSLEEVGHEEGGVMVGGGF